MANRPSKGSRKKPSIKGGSRAGDRDSKRPRGGKKKAARGQRKTQAKSGKRRYTRAEEDQPAELLLVVGWLRRHKNAVWIEPEPAAPPQFVKDGSAEAIETDAAVRFEATQPSTGIRVAEATVLERLGPEGDDSTLLKMAEAVLPLPNRFSNDVLEQAERFDEVDVENVDGGRRDLRERPHVTIDGEHAQDFDDAVSAVEEEDGYRVWVSIADVASYVKARSAIDREARSRGTSVYLPTQVFPMLPERLSNGLCSLVPGEPRYTLTCEMHVDADGKRNDICIYPSLICSAARLTYAQVQKLIERNTGVPKKVSALVQSAIAASKLLRRRRFSRGSLDLEISEAEVIFSRSGELTNVVGRAQLASNQVIEDLMVAANESVAEYLVDQNLAGVYRVHPPPPQDKWTRLRSWAKQYGLHLSSKSSRNGKGLAQFLNKIKLMRQAEAGQMMLLRSLSQAYYSTECEGHYGLASDAYAHFTSPIRRYPDLLVHRALWNHWNGKSRLSGLEKMAESSSDAERRAVQAEREITQLAACLVAKKRIGEEMEATIVGVHAMGLFVRPKDLYADGLVPMEQLSRRGGEYFEVREETQTVVGRNSRSSYGLGDSLKVRLAAVDVGLKRMNFELAAAAPTGPANTPKGRRQTKASKPRASGNRKSGNRKSGKRGT